MHLQRVQMRDDEKGFGMTTSQEKKTQKIPRHFQVWDVETAYGSQSLNGRRLFRQTMANARK